MNYGTVINDCLASFISRFHPPFCQRDMKKESTDFSLCFLRDTLLNDRISELFFIVFAFLSPKQLISGTCINETADKLYSDPSEIEKACQWSDLGKETDLPRVYKCYTCGNAVRLLLSGDALFCADGKISRAM